MTTIAPGCDIADFEPVSTDGLTVFLVALVS